MPARSSLLRLREQVDGDSSQDCSEQPDWEYLEAVAVAVDTWHAHVVMEEPAEPFEQALRRLADVCDVRGQETGRRLRAEADRVAGTDGPQSEAEVPTSGPGHDEQRVPTGTSQQFSPRFPMLRTPEPDNHVVRDRRHFTMLERVTVQGFTPFGTKAASLEFVNGSALVVGPTGSGKSVLLRIISSAWPVVHSACSVRSADLDRLQCQDDASVCFEFIPSEELKNQMVAEGVLGAEESRFNITIQPGGANGWSRTLSTAQHDSFHIEDRSPFHAMLDSMPLLLLRQQMEAVASSSKSVVNYLLREFKATATSNDPTDRAAYEAVVDDFQRMCNVSSTVSVTPQTLYNMQEEAAANPYTTAMRSDHSWRLTSVSNCGITCRLLLTALWTLRTGKRRAV